MSYFRRLLICFFLLSSLTNIQAMNQEEEQYESFVLAIDFDKIGRKSFFALYNDTQDEIYLPVQEIFEFLRIYHQSSEQGKVLTGYLNNENHTFIIDFEKKIISFNNQTFTTDHKSLIYDTGALYMTSKSLEEIMGFNISFNFRALSARMGAEFEFPLVRYLKLENARANLNRMNGIMHYDDTIPRKYQMFKAGMIDWSLSSMQGLFDENRIGIAAGAEILGGEASAWFIYSDVFGLNRNQQRYYWRLANNNSKLIRQIQVGRIYNHTITSLLHPVDGITITNAPSTVRKALGNYLISDHTEPDWLVELYINNILVDFTTADASGFYRFDVPITYGSTRVMLRFYGPNGEERTQERNFYMPYNFLPAGEVDYRITAGYVLNGHYSPFGRAEVNYGLTKGVTIGAGLEYSGTITGNSPFIPFLSASIQPFNRMIIIGEYAHKVRKSVMINYTMPSNCIIELNHTRFDKDQTAIIFNYLEENSARISFPFISKKYSGFVRGGFRQFKYSNFVFNSGETSLSGFIGRFNANLANFISWTTVSSPYVYSNLSMGYRMPRNLNLRSSVQYSLSNNQWIGWKVEAEKQISRRGLLAIGYEQNVKTGYNSINLGLRFDFSFMSAFTSTNFTNNRIISSQNARGSLAFGSGNRYIHADRQNAVGRSGVSVYPYVDINHNAIMDENEPIAENMNVRSKGGQMITRSKDNILRLTGMEPFVEYGLILDELGFDNLSWRVAQQNVLVTTDPNQFKQIFIPVTPMGEVHGRIVDETDTEIGRILVNVFNSEKSLVAKTQSEDDGYFSYLGLSPGQYHLEVDSLQLSILNMTADRIEFTINPSIEGDITDVGKIVLRRIPEIVKEDSLIIPSNDSALTVIVPEAEKTSIEEVVLNDVFCSPILFDFDKAEIRFEVQPYLVELAEALKQNPALKLLIEGHTCSMGSYEYNLRLSERRSRSVRNFLIKHGVEAERLFVKASGEEKPLNENRTNTERALNRRATFTLQQ